MEIIDFTCNAELRRLITINMTGHQRIAMPVAKLKRAAVAITVVDYDFVTRSGFIITPVVVWGGTEVALVKNDIEVSSLHRIPCAELLRRDAPHLDISANSAKPLLFMPVGDSWIAAPTAAILFQFREVALLGRKTRVSHYEQPSFAWR